MHLIADAADLQQLLQQQPLVVILYSAPWCKPCEKLYPRVLDMEDEFPEVLWAKENVDLDLTPGIQSIPRFRVFDHGKLYEEILGGNCDALRETLALLCD